jgi:hypothetical protein
MSDLPPCPTTKELADRLTAPLGSKDRFGKNGAEVLVTAGLVAAANASWDKGTIGTFQDNQKLHPKVWDKLVAIARSENLKGLPEKSLPASYTAIYGLVVMSDEEFSAAVAEGDLVTDGASSRSLLDWTKAYRLRGTGIGKEVLLTLVLPDDLTPQQHKILLSALKETAAEFGAQVLEGKGGIKQAGLKADRRKALASEIEEHLMQEIASVVSGAPEELKTRFSIRSASDLIEGPRTTFTGFFQNLEGKVDGAFWRNHGRAYCLKIARDFNLTDSRAERFQLKDRLKKATDKWTKEIHGFEEMVLDIKSTYMNR